MPPSRSLPPLEFCYGTRPIQAEKSRPDRNAFGSATLATSAVASAGTPVRTKPAGQVAGGRLDEVLIFCRKAMKATACLLSNRAVDGAGRATMWQPAQQAGTPMAAGNNHPMPSAGSPPSRAPLVGRCLTVDLPLA